MENVPGMMSYKDGNVAEQIKKDLVASGYPNTDYKILNAVNFGVPQKRKRIIFIGTREDTAIQWPEMTHKQLKDDQARLDTQVPVTVRDAFGDLPELKLPERGSKAKDKVVAYAKRAISEYQEFVRDGSTELHNHITRWHRDKDITIFDFMEEGMRWKDLPDMYRKMIGYSDSSFNDKWKRLVLDEPSWTVVSHLSKDGYMYIHPTESRTISVREAARLQSFPDSFVFYGSRGSQFKQIGNAVPPLLAMAIANSVKKMLK
jgi:DNA (cytosine-5)-methyltransferase 1